MPQKIDEQNNAQHWCGSSASRLCNELDAADYLGLTPATLRRWRWAGTGPRFYRIGARAIRYSPDDLAAFIEAGRRTSTSDPGHGDL